MKRKLTKQSGNCGDIKKFFTSSQQSSTETKLTPSDSGNLAVTEPCKTRSAARKIEETSKAAIVTKPKRRSRRLKNVEATPPATPEKKAKILVTPNSPNIVEAFRRASEKFTKVKSAVPQRSNAVGPFEVIDITTEGVEDEELAREMNYRGRHLQRPPWSRGRGGQLSQNNSFQSGYNFNPQFQGRHNYPGYYGNQQNHPGHMHAMESQENYPWRSRGNNHRGNNLRGQVLLPTPRMRGPGNNAPRQPRPTLGQQNARFGSPGNAPRHGRPYNFSAPRRTPNFSPAVRATNPHQTQQAQNHTNGIPVQMRPHSFYGSRGQNRPQPNSPRQLQSLPRAPDDAKPPDSKPSSNLTSDPTRQETFGNNSANNVPVVSGRENTSAGTTQGRIPICEISQLQSDSVKKPVLDVPSFAQEKVKERVTDSVTNAEGNSKIGITNTVNESGSSVGKIDGGQQGKEESYLSPKKEASDSSGTGVPTESLVISPSQQRLLSNIVQRSPLLSKLGGDAGPEQRVQSKDETVKDEPVATGTVSTPPEETTADEKSPSSVRKSLFSPQKDETEKEKGFLSDDNDDFELEEIEFLPSIGESQPGNGFLPQVQVEKREEEESETPKNEGHIQKGLLNMRNIFKSGVTSSPSSNSNVKSSPQIEPDDSEETGKQEPEQQTSFISDSLNSGFDIDYSDVDSDDDDLLETPSLFTKISNLVKEGKNLSSASSSKFVPSDSESEAETPAEFKHYSADEEISMDTLLLAKAQQDKADAEFESIEARVAEGLRLGGVRNIVIDSSQSQNDEGDIDLPAEIQENVKKLTITKQEIQEVHPGLTIFRENGRQIFSYPQTLSLESCGFLQGSSTIDRYLASLQPDMLPFSLTQDLVLLCFDAISCPHAFMDWLFQLVSVHPNSLVVRNIYSILYSAIQKKKGKACNWVPSIQIIARVFVNFGADLKSLFPHQSAPSLSLDDLKDTSDKENQVAPPDDTGDPIPGGAGEQQQEAVLFRLENLQRVYQIIAEAANKRAEFFKTEDVFSLIVMMLVTALDKRLNQEVLTTDIGITLAALLYAVPENSWKDKVKALCQIVHKLASHHHNKSFLVTVLPPCDRGRYLQRRMAFSMLHELLRGQTVGDDIIDLKVQDLHSLVPLIKIKGADTDYYLASSLISLVDASVGNETLPSREKADLVKLTGLMRNKMSEVRESINIMDRSLVKDQLVRLTSKWTFMYQGMGSKERTLFAYTTTSVGLPEGKVDCRDDSDSDMELDSLEQNLTDD